MGMVYRTQLSWGQSLWWSDDNGSICIIETKDGWSQDGRQLSQQMLTIPSPVCRSDLVLSSRTQDWKRGRVPEEGSCNAVGNAHSDDSPVLPHWQESTSSEAAAPWLGRVSHNCQDGRTEGLWNWNRDLKHRHDTPLEWGCVGTNGALPGFNLQQFVDSMGPTGSLFPSPTCMLGNDSNPMSIPVSVWKVTWKLLKCPHSTKKADQRQYCVPQGGRSEISATLKDLKDTGVVTLVLHLIHLPILVETRDGLRMTMDCPNSRNCARCGVFAQAGSHGFRHRANGHWFSVCGLLHLCQERASEASAFTGTEQQHTPVALLGLWFPPLSHVAHRDLNQLDVNSVHCVDDIILLGLNGQEVASAQEVFVRHSCLRGCKLRLTEIQGPTTPGQWLGDHQPGPARDILSEVRDNSSLLVAPTAKKEDQPPGSLGSGGRIFPTRGYCFSLYTRWCERLPAWVGPEQRRARHLGYTAQHSVCS